MNQAMQATLKRKEKAEEERLKRLLEDSGDETSLFGEAEFLQRYQSGRVSPRGSRYWEAETQTWKAFSARQLEKQPTRK